MFIIISYTLQRQIVDFDKILKGLLKHNSLKQVNALYKTFNIRKTYENVRKVTSIRPAAGVKIV